MNNYWYMLDTSYICYFTGFSTFKQYVDQFGIRNVELGPEFDPTLDPEFCYMFESNLRYNILKPVQTVFPLVDKSKFVFCMDCSRTNIWRRRFYPEYKLNRDLKDTSKNKFNIGRMFKYAYDVIIPNLCDEFGAHKVLCQYAEGDDVIAVLTKQFLSENENNKVIIVSCDKDMVQLASNRVTIITIDGKRREPKLELQSALKLKTELEEDITANDFLLFKILIGDTADNIPNVKIGMGPKKAFSYVTDKSRDKLKTLLTEDRLIAESFHRNKKLIAMSEIPQEINDLILIELNNEKLIRKNLQDL